MRFDPALVKWLATGLFVSVLSVSTTYAVHYGKGPKSASTNAPGESSCQAEKCHAQNALNSGGGELAVTGIPEIYEPGKRYTLSITLLQKGQKRWGFQMTVLNEDSLPAGEFLLLEPKLTQLKTEAAADGSVRQYVEHTLEGSHMGRKDGPISWAVAWQAPNKPEGRVTFYTAANAANFNKKPWGDFIYTTLDTSEAPALAR